MASGKKGVRKPAQKSVTPALKAQNSQPKPPVTREDNRPPKSSTTQDCNDRPLTKREEKRVVKFRLELEGIIEDMRKEPEIYGSLLQDLLPVRNRLEELTDIIKSEQTVEELRKASRSLREDEPDVWKKLFEDVYPDLPDSQTPSPKPQLMTGGKKRKVDRVEDKELKAPPQTPKKQRSVTPPVRTAVLERTLRSTRQTKGS